MSHPPSSRLPARAPRSKLPRAQLSRSRWRLPGWSSHPLFGVLMLFVLAVFLIWRGEPQPSSRPSGTSVAVSGTSSAATGQLPALLVIRGDLLEQVRGGSSRAIALPDRAVPRALVTSKGLTVVLALVQGRQRAFAVTAKLAVTDLGYADAVLPSARGDASVIVESAVIDPGAVPLPSPTATPSGTELSSSTSRSAPSKQPDLRDFSYRRYDASGQVVQTATLLPLGFRAAVDTAVGLTVWQPVNRVFDNGVELESLSAAARLIRPDGTERLLGPVHPLASTATQLLVWDVAVRRFGMMPLDFVTSTATSTVSASPSAPVSDSASASGQKSNSASASPTPTVVAGTKWFLPTRGMLLVTGPAAFNRDGSAFAVYAQVGARRRLVVAQLKNLGTDQVEVLVLAQPETKSSPVPSASGSLITPSPAGSSRTASTSPTPTEPALAPDGYPISAPLTPIWLADTVVAVGQDSTVIGYKPGSTLSSQLDLGLTDVRSLALAP